MKKIILELEFNLKSIKLVSSYILMFYLKKINEKKLWLTVYKQDKDKCFIVGTFVTLVLYLWLYGGIIIKIITL